MLFYHIAAPAEWAKFAESDFYEAPSLHTENFIHASFAEQLEETLRVHYPNAERVVLLTVDSDLLAAPLKIEKSRGGELFPHIYGAINKAAIVRVEERNLQTNARNS